MITHQQHTPLISLSITARKRCPTCYSATHTGRIPEHTQTPPSRAHSHAHTVAPRGASRSHGEGIGSRRTGDVPQLHTQTSTTATPMHIHLHPHVSCTQYHVCRSNNTHFAHPICTPTWTDKTVPPVPSANTTLPCLFSLQSHNQAGVPFPQIRH